MKWPIARANANPISPSHAIFVRTAASASSNSFSPAGMVEFNTESRIAPLDWHMGIGKWAYLVKEGQVLANAGEAG